MVYYSPLDSKTPLNINVLFFYSPQTLNSYINMKQLIEDNNDFCFILAGILNHNIVKYKTTVTNVGNILFEDMQNESNYMKPQGIYQLLENFAKGLYSVQLKLKEQFSANLVVFLPMCILDKFSGCSCTVGFKTPTEACIALNRNKGLINKKTSWINRYVFAHEFGHVLGCSHPLLPDELPDKNLLPGYGHHVIDENYDNVCGTFLSRLDPKIAYYSNPNLFRYPSPFKNNACGKKGVAEAYKLVEKNLPRLASSI